MSRKKGKSAKARRTWALDPRTRVVPDKTKRPFRKRKHKRQAEEF